MRATDAILKDDAQANGGGVHWLADGIPSIRRVVPGQSASGSNWIGLRRNGAYRVTSLTQQPLLPAWAALLLIIGLCCFSPVRVEQVLMDLRAITRREHKRLPRFARRGASFSKRRYGRKEKLGQRPGEVKQTPVYSGFALRTLSR